MDHQHIRPHRFTEWLAQLQQRDLGHDFVDDTATRLRVIANTKSAGVFLVAGNNTLAYADWVLDGMAMDSRLVVLCHSQALAEFIQPHYATDIRVAVHCQEVGAFLSDITRHKIDLALIDLVQIEIDTLKPLLALLSDSGLLITVGAKSKQQELRVRLDNDYFTGSLDKDDLCTIATRKALQHRAVRRGGRRTRTKSLLNG